MFFSTIFFPASLLDERGNHLCDERKEHQSLDAGVLLRSDRSDLECRFEQRMPLLNPGLVLVNLEHVDGLLFGIRRETVSTCFLPPRPTFRKTLGGIHGTHCGAVMTLSTSGTVGDPITDGIGRN